ncbi:MULTISPECIES: hypothetical protein [Pseudoalteromonas]|uniref:hypothetical protein n=1 Tax=Pseudoalteromonas TaxID=53246 RepID=UPI003003273B
MKVYLDHNLIIYLRQSSNKQLDNKQLENKVKEMKENGFRFIFSPAHLEEIAVSAMRNKTKKNIIDADIKFLTNLCGTNSLRPRSRNDKDIEFGKEYPIDCYKRVIEHYSSNDYAETVDKGIIERANDNPHSNPKKANNQNPKDVLSNITYISLILQSLMHHGLITQCEAIKKLQSSPHYNLTNKFCILEHSVNYAANLLEQLGYYREKTKKSRSRLHDVSHIIYGKYADIFVTNDTKLLKKTQAIYSLFDIDTKVLTKKEFIQLSIS